MKFLLFLALICTATTTIVVSLTCSVGSGKTCSNAGYCTANWQRTNGNWQASNQYCIQSTVAYPSAVLGWQPIAANQASIVCATDNCNNNAPPSSVPTVGPPIQCHSSVPPGTTSCTGQGCTIISITGPATQTSTGCDSTGAGLRAYPANKKGCTQVVSAPQGTQSTVLTCECQTANCNTNDLVTWGNSHLASKTYTCNIGSQKTAKGAYCMILQAQGLSQTMNMSVTATEAPGVTGCQKTYNDTATLTQTCICASNTCAFPNPWPTPSPTAKPGGGADSLKSFTLLGLVMAVICYATR